MQTKYLYAFVLPLLFFLFLSCSSGGVVAPTSADGPVARFTHTAPGGYLVNQYIIFDASSSASPLFDIVEFEWDWDDGSDPDPYVSAKPVTHIFTKVGTHDVQLTIRDVSGQTAQTNQVIEIFPPGSAPVSLFTYSAPDGWQPGSTLHFDGSESYDPEGEELTYFWDWGDGNTSGSGPDPRASHTFNVEGEVDVILTVEDAPGYVTESEPTTISFGYPDGIGIANRVDIGGFITDMAITENFLYLTANGAGLKIFDISNPESPILINQALPEIFNAHQLSIDGDRAAISTHNDPQPNNYQIFFLDISDKDNPSIISSQAGQGLLVTDLAIYRNSVFFTCDGVISTVDFTNPSHPVSDVIELSEDSFDHLKIINGNLFSSSIHGVYIFSLADPFNPSLLSIYDPGTRLDPIEISGTILFAMTDIQGHLHIVDISDLTNPVALSVTDTDFNRVLSFHNGILAIGGSGIALYDIGDGTMPQLLGYAPAIQGSGNIIWVSNFLYVADDDQLTIIDGSNLSGPEIIARVNGNGITPTDIEIVGDKAFMSGAPFRLQVMDIGNPHDPFIISQVDAPPYNYPDLKNVEIYENCAYVLFEQLLIYDITNPANPLLRNSIDVDDTTLIQIVNGTMYLGSKEYSLRIFDLADPMAPNLSGVYQWTGAGEIDARSLSVSGDYAYVGGYVSPGVDPVILILNASDPDYPTIANIYYMGNPGEYPMDSDVGGDFLYILNYVSYSDRELVIMDISIPDSPVTISRSILPNNSIFMKVLGDYAYITSRYSGLYIVNISDRWNPRIAGFVYLRYNPRAVDISNDIALIGSSENGAAYTIIQLW